MNPYCGWMKFASRATVQKPNGLIRFPNVDTKNQLGFIPMAAHVFEPIATIHSNGGAPVSINVIGCPFLGLAGEIQTSGEEGLRTSRGEVAQLFKAELFTFGFAHLGQTNSHSPKR